MNAVTHHVPSMLALVAAMATAGTAAAQPRTGWDCLIDPAQVVEVRAAADGLIARVNVRRGDTIRRGQVLVELQSGPERVAVEAARYRSQMEGPQALASQRVRHANAKLERADQLLKDRFVSVQARDEAESELRLAQSELRTATENRELAAIEWRRAQEQLALRTMLAPFDGVVLDRLLNPGDLAEAGAGRKPVLRVAQVDPLKVEVIVPAVRFGSIRPGTRVTVTPVGLPGRHTGTVSAIDKVIDAASGTFIVRLDLRNPAHAIPAGVRCTAEIEAPAPSGEDLKPLSDRRAARAGS